MLRTVLTPHPSPLLQWAKPAPTKTRGQPPTHRPDAWAIFTTSATSSLTHPSTETASGQVSARRRRRRQHRRQHRRRHRRRRRRRRRSTSITRQHLPSFKSTARSQPTLHSHRPRVGMGASMGASVGAAVASMGAAVASVGAAVATAIMRAAPVHRSCSAPPMRTSTASQATHRPHRSVVAAQTTPQTTSRTFRPEDGGLVGDTREEWSLATRPRQTRPRPLHRLRLLPPPPPTPLQPTRSDSTTATTSTSPRRCST